MFIVDGLCEVRQTDDAVELEYREENGYGNEHEHPEQENPQARRTVHEADEEDVIDDDLAEKESVFVEVGEIKLGQMRQQDGQKNAEDAEGKGPQFQGFGGELFQNGRDRQREADQDQEFIDRQSHQRPARFPPAGRRGRR